MKKPPMISTHILPLPLLRLIAAFSILAVLTACESPTFTPTYPSPITKPLPQSTTQPPRQSNTPSSGTALLAAAQRNTGIHKSTLEIQAIFAFIQEGNSKQAHTILRSIQDSDLNPNLLAQKRMANAELALLNQRPTEALKWLDQASSRNSHINFEQTLSSDRLLYYFFLRANALEQANQFPKAALLRSKIATQPLQKPELARNNEAIWLLLNRIAPDRLENLNNHPENVNPNNFRGWIELVKAVKSQQNSLTGQSQAIQAWLKSWPDHDVHQHIPSAINLIQKAVQYNPAKVALLLPESGRYQQAAQTIKKGFMGAFYKAQNSGVATPEIHFIDTAGTESIGELLDRAKALGVETIIGPLEKERVSELNRLSAIDTPVLTLNFLNSDNSFHPNVIQYGLSAEDEARQIARYATGKSLKHAAVLYPETEWGQKVYAAFSSSWAALGGSIVDSVSYNNQNDYAQSVKQLLQIPQSEARSREIKAMVGAVESNPRRRQDIDFIVLLGNSRHGRQLKPALNYYYAKNLPVFSTSHIYSGNPNQQFDKDLNGIEYTEIPWFFSSDVEFDALKIQNSANLPRLFALGVDAYALYPRINLMSKTGSVSIEGLTGRLHLNDKGRIVRESAWAEFKSGRPSLVQNP